MKKEQPGMNGGKYACSHIIAAHGTMTSRYTGNSRVGTFHTSNQMLLSWSLTILHRAHSSSKVTCSRVYIVMFVVTSHEYPNSMSLNSIYPVNHVMAISQVSHDLISAGFICIISSAAGIYFPNCPCSPHISSETIRIYGSWWWIACPLSTR